MTHLRPRRGQSAIETVLGLLFVVSFAVLVLQVLDAGRVVLQVSAAGSWLDAAAAAGDAHDALDRAEDAAGRATGLWPALDASVTEGCVDGLRPTGVQGLDRSTTTVGYALDARGLVDGYSPDLRVAGGACVGVGVYARADVGGDLVDVDPTFFGAAARARLAPIYR